MHIESMESWLHHHINTNSLNTKDSLILDVGAYHGDFTKKMLLNKSIEKACLFEANKDNHTILEAEFAKNRQIELYHCAVSDQEGEIEFHCDSDKATGSILPYQYWSADAPEVKKQVVKMISLDNHFNQHPLSQRISIIKIDTQGNDLSVLKGAKQTLASHQPWLVVELVYVPLYKNQGNPDEIAHHLAAQNYGLAGMFNMNYSADGWLAFADGVFVPRTLMNSFKTPFQMNFTDSELIAENKMLRTACDERLELINRLHGISTLPAAKSSLLSKITKKVFR
jgi:FkbM family methyltransferase